MQRSTSQQQSELFCGHIQQPEWNSRAFRLVEKGNPKFTYCTCNSIYTAFTKRQNCRDENMLVASKGRGLGVGGLGEC